MRRLLSKIDISEGGEDVVGIREQVVDNGFSINARRRLPTNDTDITCWINFCDSVKLPSVLFCEVINRTQSTWASCSPSSVCVADEQWSQVLPQPTSAELIFIVGAGTGA
jgi:hypothetical protein